MSLQWLPDVRLTIPGSAWPADPDLPVGVGRVAGLSIDREIVAGSLPGQVRARSGLSIGSATVAVRQAGGRPFAPWANADRRVNAGEPCTLAAVDDATGETHPLGAWETKTPAGALSRADVSVELIEGQYAGRKAVPRLPTTSEPCDAIWLVDQLARQAGFTSTPPHGDAVWSAPLCGSPVGRGQFGNTSESGTVGAVWSMATGVPGLASATTMPTWSTSEFSDFWVDRVLTLNAAGTVVLKLVTWGTDVIYLRVGGGKFALRLNAGAWGADQAFTAGLDPNWPTRVQFGMTRSGVSLVVRARSAVSGVWSPTKTITVTGTPTGVPGTWLQIGVESISAGGGVSAIDLRALSGADAAFAPPNARMSLLGGPVVAPWLPDTADVWTALRGVCDAYMGAAWVSLGGVMTVANRTDMAGVNRPRVVVDVAERAEDLAWTVDAADFADRLEVTWWPTTPPESDADPTVVQVGDKVRVPAGQSVTVRVDLGGYVARVFDGWVNAGSTTLEPYSWWEANTAADGSGSPVVSGVSVTTDQTTPSAVRVTVTNQTGVEVWMVDPDGAPALLLRHAGAVAQETPQVIMFGASDADAVSPLTIDLGKTVQSAAVAESLAAYLWERVNRPRFRVNAVRLPMDWARDLGDVLALRHPDSALSVEALVTKVSLSGQPGELRQVVDLVLLPPTWADFDAAWSASTWTAFDAAWSARNWPAFDAEPLRTGA